MDPLLGQLVADKWRVVERLEPARCPNVYRAEQVPSGESALIELAVLAGSRQLGEVARFDREARIASQVKHSQLARILDFGVWRDRPFVVSELPRGKPLGSLVGTVELTPRRAVGLAIQIVEAVRYLHANGVVHRDVTLDKVVVLEAAGGDQIKLSPPGFGLAHEAPAQRRPDQTGDLLAIARVLQAMCAQPPTGDEPDGAASAGRDIGEWLKLVIAKGTAPQPEARFKSAEELLAALTRGGGFAPRPERRSRPRIEKSAVLAKATRSSRFSVRLAWGAAGLVALAGAGIVIASARAGRRAAPVVVEQPNSELPSQALPARAPAPLQAKAPDPEPAADPPERARPPAAIRAAPVAARSPQVVAAAAVPVPPRPIVRPPPRPAPVAASPVRAATAPAPAKAPARVAVAVAPIPVTPAERAEVLRLIGARDDDAARERITTLMQRDPRVAWPHVALAEFHFRHLWRHDVVRQWQIALELDPSVKDDPLLAKHLCLAKGPKWDAAGIGELVAALGEQGAALLAACPS